MKLYLLMVLLASFLMLAAAAPSAVVLDQNTTSASTLGALTGAFTVTLGVNGVVLGSFNHREDTVHQVRKGLRMACPDGSAQTCTNGVGTFKGSFGTDLTITVMSAKWDGNREVYDILVDAVALIAVNGVGPMISEKCEDPSYCTTWDRFDVTFMDGRWGMNVALENKRNSYTKNDCWKHLQDAKNVLSYLQPRLEKVTGDGDLYVDAKCYEPHKRSA